MVPSKHHGRAKGALYLLRSPGLSSEEEMEALDPLMSLELRKQRNGEEDPS